MEISYYFECHQYEPRYTPDCHTIDVAFQFGAEYIEDYRDIKSKKSIKLWNDVEPLLRQSFGEMSIDLTLRKITNNGELDSVLTYTDILPIDVPAFDIDSLLNNDPNVCQKYLGEQQSNSTDDGCWTSSTKEVFENSEYEYRDVKITNPISSENSSLVSNSTTTATKTITTSTTSTESSTITTTKTNSTTMTETTSTTTSSLISTTRTTTTSNTKSTTSTPTITTTKTTSTTMSETTSTTTSSIISTTRITTTSITKSTTSTITTTKTTSTTETATISISSATTTTATNTFSTTSTITTTQTKTTSTISPQTNGTISINSTISTTITNTLSALSTDYFPSLSDYYIQQSLFDYLNSSAIFVTDELTLTEYEELNYLINAVEKFESTEWTGTFDNLLKMFRDLTGVDTNLLLKSEFDMTLTKIFIFWDLRNHDICIDSVQELFEISVLDEITIDTWISNCDSIRRAFDNSFIEMPAFCRLV